MFAELLLVFKFLARPKIRVSNMIIVPKIDDVIMERFVNFLYLPQRYNFGFLSPAIWRHIRAKALKIVQTLLKKETDTSSIYAVVKRIDTHNLPNLLTNRTIFNTYFNLDAIYLIKISLKYDMLNYILSSSSNLKRLFCYDVAMDTKLIFSDIVSKVPKALELSFRNIDIEMDENWTTTLTLNKDLRIFYLNIKVADVNVEKVYHLIKHFWSYQVCSVHSLLRQVI